MPKSPADIDVHTFCMTHAQVDRWLRTQIARALEKTRLTMMEWLLLMGVKKHKDEGLTISQMAEILGVSLPQVTALTQQLLHKSLIKQQVERRDRRSRRLCISDQGEKLCQNAKQDVQETISEVGKAPLLRRYAQVLGSLVE